MGAKGNKFWEARSSHGRSPIYSDPEALRDACFQYFEWVEANPLIEVKPMVVAGIIDDASIPKMRAMTFQGCARFVGLGYSTWCEYRVKDDFSEVIEEAEQIMREQKLVGAAAGFLNANIIARDLGLKDSSEVSGPNGGPIKTQQITFVPVGNESSD